MPKILVIEDSHLLRNDIVELLNLEGYDVLAAENGRHGVQAAREFQPDLIICDIMMPELDGYGVLEAVRHDPGTAATPFIFMTAKTDKSDIRLGMGLGADDYLTKPFLTSDLLNSIQARLERRALTDEDAMRKLDQLRESIVTALPHELRTPLNAILGFSDMLVSEGPGLTRDQVVDWAGHIHAAGLRLYNLIEKYLTYVRLETLARAPEKLVALRAVKTPDPGAVIEFEVIHQVNEAGRDPDLVLRIQETGAVRIAEPDLIKIVHELADNAIKFSEPGTTIEIEAAENGDFYEIRIRNLGHGMTGEQIEAVGAYLQFDRWLYEQQGMGLGLAISRRLTELVGGSFHIESTPGENTTVLIRLPLVN